MSKPYPISDHYDGARFYNLDRKASINKSLWEVLKWRIAAKRPPLPKILDKNHVPKVPSDIQNGEIFSTYINHCTFLIQLYNLNILTDPIFSKRAGPNDFLGPKRLRPPGLEIKELPKIDVVVVSHNHYDHLNIKSLKELYHLFKPTFLVPLGNAKLLSQAGIKSVHELDWWQTYLHDQGKFTLCPAQHWSARGVNDRSKALWGAYFLESHSTRIYFSGDTGYNSHFKETRKKLGAPHVSFLGAGAYEPRWFMNMQHMNPQEAVQAHLDLQSKKSVAMHYGTFELADEGLDEPPIAIKKELERLALDPSTFLCPENGQTLSFIF